MQRTGLRAPTKRKRGNDRQQTQAAGGTGPRAAPLRAEAPNRLWSGDITCTATDESWLYLAAVINLFSRQLVGWSMQPHIQTSLVKDALTMAWFRRRPPAGLILHSDRGSQYCSHELQQALRDWHMRSSMSGKGNCWDNAPTESL